MASVFTLEGAEERKARVGDCKCVPVKRNGRIVRYQKLCFVGKARRKGRGNSGWKFAKGSCSR